MSKAKLGLLLGAPLISGLAFAAAPQFGNWEVDAAGNIDACSNRTDVVSCQVLVNDVNFIQVQVKDDQGNNYIQSILTDGGAGTANDVPFWDENYIRINFQAQVSTIASWTFGDPGFMGRQAILDRGITSGNTWFEATTQIATGWGLDILYGGATADTAVAVDLTTDFYTTDGGVDGNYNGMFDTGFYYQAYNNEAGDIIGRIINIDQDLSLDTANDTLDDEDRQFFVYYDRSGELLKTSGVWGSSTDSLTNLDDTFKGPVGDPANNKAEWTAGGNAIAFWIDQVVTTAGVANGYGENGKSSFYHLQVDTSPLGPNDDIMAYSQAGSGFAESTIGEMGGYADWFSDAEFSEFPPPAHLTAPGATAPLGAAAINVTPPDSLWFPYP